MKKIVCAITFFVFSVCVLGQTQTGVVKTRGRMVNGQLQPGKGLANATVEVKNHAAVISAADGRFSFPLHSQTYLLKSVNKNGYQLVDLEACRNYHYSTDPLYLVMETPEQLRSDQLAAERKIRRNLQQQLHEREDEIEALKVSQQEKDSLLRILYQQQGDNEKLIADMAKRYSTLDYDQLDEFYRQVSWYIENGELTRADSLLRTRGDINAQVQEILKKGEAIQQQERQLQQAKTVHKADIDEAARRCYSYCETSWANHQRDSAVYYLELRARLDSTNVEWWYEAGALYKILANYPKAIYYYKQALRQLSLQYGEKSENVTDCLLRIGLVYSEQADYSMAMQYYDNALAIQKEISGEDNSFIAGCYSSIGALYYHQGDYPKAQEYYMKALSIRNKVLDSNHPDIAGSFLNIGMLLEQQREYVKAEEYLKKALKIYEEVLDSQHIYIAACYNNLAAVYKESGDYTKSLDYLKKSLSIISYIYGSDHPETALRYNNIGFVFRILGEEAKALEFYNMALEIWEKYGTETPNVASCYINAAELYKNRANYSKSSDYYEKALVIREKVFGVKHPDVLTSYCLLGNIYMDEGELSKSLEYFTKFLDLHEDTNGIDELVATAYLNIGMIYVKEGNYILGLKYLDKSIPILENCDSKLAKKVKDDSEFLKKNLEFRIFTATIIENDSPARQQGLSGEYIVLEFADWNMESTMSLFELLEEYKGKPKTILIMKDENITQHHFENNIGAQIKTEIISYDEMQQINAAYDKWKGLNK